MRIASQGGPLNNGSSEKKQTRGSDPGGHRVELNSVEGNRSLDPDHEPRKEGTLKNMKHSPSVIEIGGMNDGGLQSDANSIGGDDRSFRKGGSQSKSPVPGNGRLHGIQS